MFNKLMRIKNSGNISKEQLRVQLWEAFKENGQHQWILSDKTLLRHFAEFYSRLPQRAVLKMAKDKPTCFLKANGQFACTLSSIEKTHTVIMFPQLIKILKSASPERGLAILAHEFGHIIEDHFKKEISAIASQIEADKMAFNMGFGDELLDFLLDQNRTSEIKIRVYKLTERLSPIS